jgi:hypothetical protein
LTDDPIVDESLGGVGILVSPRRWMDRELNRREKSSRTTFRVISHGAMIPRQVSSVTNSRTLTRGQ